MATDDISCDGKRVTASTPLESKLPLQQDLIGNTRNPDIFRVEDSVVGRRTGVNNTRVDLWEGPTGTYVFPVSAIGMQVVSSSANDAAAGTGVQIVHFHYLDQNYAPKFEQITLNGTTPVLTTATNILRINAFHALQAGTGEVAAGNISLQAIGGAVTYGFISAGNNLARHAIYTVPAGKTGFISQWDASSGSSTANHFCQFDLRAKCHSGVACSVFVHQSGLGTQDGGDNISFKIPIAIPEKTDVKLSATSDTANANVIAIGGIRGWVE